MLFTYFSFFFLPIIISNAKDQPFIILYQLLTRHCITHLYILYGNSLSKPH